MQTEGFCDGFCDEQEDRTEQLGPQTRDDGVYSSQGRRGAWFSPEAAPGGVTQAGGRAGSVVDSEVGWGVMRGWETGDCAPSSSSWVSTYLHHRQVVRTHE